MSGASGCKELWWSETPTEEFVTGTCQRHLAHLSKCYVIPYSLYGQLDNWYLMSLPARILSQIYSRLCVCTSPRAEHEWTYLWPTLLPWPNYLHCDHSPWWRFFVLLRVHMMDIMMMILRSTDLTLARDVIQVHAVMIIRQLPVTPLPDLTLGSKPLSHLEYSMTFFLGGENGSTMENQVGSPLENHFHHPESHTILSALPYTI